MCSAASNIGWYLKSRKYDHESEYRFAQPRRWRFDYALVGERIAIEIEGLVFKDGAKGRHQTIKGYTGDCEKYNTAAILGWLVLRFTQPMIRDGTAYEQIEAAIRSRMDAAEPTTAP